jgi:type II secretion system protein I
MAKIALSKLNTLISVRQLNQLHQLDYHRLCINKRKGFTLIEILVALVIISLIMSSAIFASIQRVRQQQYIQQKSMALWSLANTWEMVQQNSNFSNLSNFSGNLMSCPQASYNFVCKVIDEPIYSKKDNQQILVHRFKISVQLNEHTIEHAYFYKKS